MVLKKEKRVIVSDESENDAFVTMKVLWGKMDI